MKKITIILCSVLLFASSCKKWNEGVNVDPNNPTDVGTRYDLLINGAEVSTVLFFESAGRQAGLWTRAFTGADRQYLSLYNYNTTSGDYDDNWGRVYASILANAKTAEQKALQINDKTSAGIAEVLQALAFGTAADLWGDVPFKEAGDPVTYPKPHFDPQVQVYAGVQTLLTTAIANLNANVGNGPGTKDFLGGGSRTRWIAAAYTLKARFYLHTKDYDNAITNALLGLSSAAQNIVAPHGTSYYSDINVYYAFLSNDRYGYMSAENSFEYNLLNTHTNARTNETGRKNYLFISNYVYSLDPNFSSTGFFYANNSFPIITWQENQLTLAEAYMKKATPDPVNALAALNTVRAYYAAGGSTKTGSTVVSTTSAQYDPYLLTDFAPGGTANPLASGMTQNQALLKEILIERYITFTGQIEQFNDVRRTKNLLGIPPVTGTKLPQRYLYAQSEINTNPNTPPVTASDLFKETAVNTTPY